MKAAFLAAVVFAGWLAGCAPGTPTPHGTVSTEGTVQDCLQPGSPASRVGADDVCPIA